MRTEGLRESLNRAILFLEWVGIEIRAAPFIQAYKVRCILAMCSFFVPLIRELLVLIFSN